MVSALALSPDGKMLASGSFDQTLKLWYFPTGELSTTLRGHLAQIHAVVFSPDGQAIAIAGQDQTIEIWRYLGFLPCLLQPGNP